MTPNYRVGSKIKFAEEAHRYTIQAASSRYLVCTKPFNVRKTYLYTIVDLLEQIRGTENTLLGFGEGYDREEGASALLSALDSGAVGVSYRNRAPLNIEECECTPRKD